MTDRQAASTSQNAEASPRINDRTTPAPADGLEPTRAGYADFFSRVAHDLRSPLGIVMHVIQRLETDFGSTLTDEQRAIMRLGGRSVRRLRDFVDRMSLLAVIEGDELEPSMQRFGLTELTKRCVAAVVEGEPRAGVSVSFDAPAEPHETSGDPNLVSAIIAELLRNAVAHARRIVNVGIVPEMRAIAVFVEDDGAGLPDPADPKLFARFVGHATRGGLGIGLSMARDLARAHSGDIRVEPSQLPPGRPGTVGARFVLVLPRAA